MKERSVKVPAAADAMETFITHPRGDGPFPAVILYMDVWGVREELFDIARRVATVGYYCMVPDLYYRRGTVRHAFRNEKNQMISMEALDEAQKELVRVPMRHLANSSAEFADYLRAELGKWAKVVKASGLRAD